MGVRRVMGILVEVLADEKGLVWPESVAPFAVHLIEVNSQSSEVRSAAESTYDDLMRSGIGVLYDDRSVGAGEKFADADLIGCPYRIVVSEKSLAQGGVEVKKRTEGNGVIMKGENILTLFSL